MLVAIVAAVGGALYLYRQEISDTFTSAQDGVLTDFGLGSIVVAIWLATFLWTLVRRPSWFLPFNLWIGSLVFVAFTLGFLSLFQPSTGVLGEFTREGVVTLGGDVGHVIVGDTVWLGVLRLLVVFIVGAAVTAPRQTLDATGVLGRAVVYAYVFLALAFQRLSRAVGRMYKFDSESDAGDEDIEQLEPPALPGRVRRPSVAEAAPRVSVTRPAEPVRASTAPIPALAEPSEAPDRFSDGKPSATATDDRRNRLWGKGADTPKAEHVDGEKPDTDEDGEGPILDDASGSWERPPIDLLAEAHSGGISKEEMDETAETIKRTLAEYGVEVEIGQVRPGPTVTMYGLTLGWVRRHKQQKVTDEHGDPKLDEAGKPIVNRVETRTRVKVDSILSREKDLALALKTHSIRIETPAMGKSLVGIEVPNPAPSLVTLRGVMQSDEFQKLRPKAKLPIALGEGSGGETVVVDLAQMPHLLVAGATGSGKSVCINTIVSCLITEKTPAELRLLLVDPKRVELTPYNGIPHLLTPVVVETDQVVALLKGLIREMLNRYRRMEEVGVRNIDSYNTKMSDNMPYLVVAIDELADLMMSASFDVEQSICRLAQLGRATGIHLIIATQRPSVDVVTGLIKANFPSRISFGVTSQVDSRTILDTAGAEKLLGKGDMLYLPVDGSKPERVQGVFISDSEIEGLVGFWRNSSWPPLPTVSLHAVGDEDRGDDGDAGDLDESRDELLDKAIQLAQSYNKMSTSLLQRRMRIGYPRAARLMDQLEDEGIVGPSDGSKSRDVIMGSTQ